MTDGSGFSRYIARVACVLELFLVVSFGASASNTDLCKSLASLEISANSNDELVPAVAHGGDTYLVVWELAYSAEDHDVLLAPVSSTGSPLPAVTAAITTRWEGSPAVAYSSDTERFLVVWEEVNESGDFDIIGQMYLGDGSTQGGLLTIAAGAGDQRQPAVQWGGGRWLVVWQQQITADPLNNDLHAVLLDSSGAVASDELVIASGDADQSAAAASWGDDRFLIGWKDATAGEYDITARTLTTAAALGTAASLASWEYDQIDPSIAYSPEDESFLVVWEDHHWGWGADWDIYARRVSAAGSALGGLVAISWEGEDPRTSPAVAYNSGNAEYQVVWEYQPTEGNRDLYRRRVSAGGAILGSETALADLSTNEASPAAAGDNQFGYLVAWEESRNAVVSGSDIYAELVEQFRLSGRVYAGSEGDTSNPLPGVTVELHCSNNQGVLGTLVSSTTTDSNGWWGLPVTAVCEYFGLWMVDPQYHLADAAASIGGEVQSATWIEYPQPLRGKTLTGNLYFTVPQDPAPEPWVNYQPTGWWTASLTASVSVQISDFGSGLDVSTAQYRVSRDAGAGWMDWSTAGCSGSDGSKGPETVTGSVVFEADNGTDYLVQFAISDMAAQRSESPVYPVKVDTTPPQNPPNVNANLTSSTWYGNGDVTLTWQPGTDTTSGVAGYSLLWDTSASTIPNTKVDDQDNHIEDTIPGDGQSWFFHLRTVDNAGNAAPGAVETGPYWLDTVPPTNPATITCNPLPDIWTASSTVSCSWAAGTDAASGVGGYSLLWDTIPGTEPDTTADITQLSTTSQSLSSNWWYMHLRTVDTVGNASWTEHAGPFKVDRTEPSSAVNSLAANQSTTSFTLSWTGSDGTGSGIASYDIRVEDVTAGTTTTWKSAIAATSATFTGQVGHTYIFASRARDLVGNLELYPASGGDALTTIGTSIPIRVRDESGVGVAGARVYLDGSYAGVTDATGLRYVPGAVIGSTVSALHKVYTQSAPKSDHGGWTWRAYLTSVGVSNTGVTSLHAITSTAEQVLTVRKNQVVIGVHLVVSVEWDATSAYLNDLEQGLENASEYLYDATDGQFFWEFIELKDNSVTLANADMRVYTTNQVWPGAHVGAIREGAGRLIKVGRLFNGASSNRGQWTQANGFRTLIHEFGHYLGLWDEYLTRNGKRAASAFCATNFDSKTTDQSEQASIMYSQYESTEFCSRADSTHTHRSQTQHDAESGGESTWETLERLYKDPTSPARWTLRSPDDRSTIVAGPTAIPVAAWSTTTVSNANTSSCAPFTHTVTTSTGKLKEGVDVWLDRPSPQPDLKQGKTDKNGEIAIYGAHNSDTVRAQISGSSASATVSCTAATKATESDPVKAGEEGLVLQDDPFSLEIRVLPLGGTVVQVVVTASAELSEAPEVNLLQTGIGDEVAVSVEWNQAQGTWIGEMTLDQQFDMVGDVTAEATDLSAHTVRRLRAFTVLETGPSDPPRIHSADGVFELLLAEGSLTGDAVISVEEVETGLDQQGDLFRVGNSYEVAVSSGEVIFVNPAVVNFRYQGAQAEGLDLDSLQLYRWNNDTSGWGLVGGVSDPDFNIVSSEVDRLSVFAVLGQLDVIFSDDFESGDMTEWSAAVGDAP